MGGSEFFLFVSFRFFGKRWFIYIMLKHLKNTSMLVRWRPGFTEMSRISSDEKLQKDWALLAFAWPYPNNGKKSRIAGLENKSYCKWTRNSSLIFIKCLFRCSSAFRNSTVLPAHVHLVFSALFNHAGTESARALSVPDVFTVQCSQASRTSERRSTSLWLSPLPPPTYLAPVKACVLFARCLRC